MNDDFIKIATAFLKSVAKELDPYTSKKSRIEQTGQEELTLFTADHIQFAKYGRGPGKQPPLDPILEWVRDKRIQFRKPNGRFTTYEGTAWAIVKGIAKNGTKNHVPNAPNALDEAIAIHMDNYLNELNINIVFEADKNLDEVMSRVIFFF